MITTREQFEAAAAAGSLAGETIERISLDGFEALSLDLSRTVFRGVSARGANLGSALLLGARLEGCDFTGVDLRSSVCIDLDASSASGAAPSVLHGARFDDSVLSGARLDGAIVTGSKLE